MRSRGAPRKPRSRRTGRLLGAEPTGTEGYGQVCGTNDLAWSASSETQAGGYILISVKARAGITCTLPAGLPSVAFGSDGTEASPAEQSVGEPVELSGAATAYAGVNPKTTDADTGKELSAIVVSVPGDQSDPVSLDRDVLGGDVDQADEGAHIGVDCHSGTKRSVDQKRPVHPPMPGEWGCSPVGGVSA